MCDVTPPPLAPSGRTPLHNLLRTSTPPKNTTFPLSLSPFTSHSFSLAVPLTRQQLYKSELGLCHHAATFTSRSPFTHEYFFSRKVIFLIIFSSQPPLLCCPSTFVRLHLVALLFADASKVQERNIEPFKDLLITGGRLSLFVVNIMNLFPVQTLMQSLPTQVTSVNLLLCVCLWNRPSQKFLSFM